MPLKYMLLDTSVLSELRGTCSNDEVLQFLYSLPDDSIAVPNVALFELRRGALMQMDKNPQRAQFFLDWIDELLATDILIPPVTAAVERLIAEMSVVPSLRRFWAHNGPSPKLRFGCDPTIAALAISYGMPIATRDIHDFMAISKLFPLPGLYDPSDDRWHIGPGKSWYQGWCPDETRNQFSSLMRKY